MGDNSRTDVWQKATTGIIDGVMEDLVPDYRGNFSTYISTLKHVRV